MEGIFQSLQANFNIAPSITIQHLPSTNSFLSNKSNNLVLRHQVNELIRKVAISETVLEESQNGLSEDYFSRLRETFDVFWQVQNLPTTFSKCGTNCSTQRKVYNRKNSKNKSETQTRVCKSTAPGLSNE